jgi:hypothetical protein
VFSQELTEPASHKRTLFGEFDSISSETLQGISCPSFMHFYDGCKHSCKSRELRKLILFSQRRLVLPNDSLNYAHTLLINVFCCGENQGFAHCRVSKLEIVILSFESPIKESNVYIFSFCNAALKTLLKC